MIRLARFLPFLAALGTSFVALAQPSPHLSRTEVPPGSSSRARTPSVPPARPSQPSDATVAAYLSGQQPLVGWHAPSAAPPPRDAYGRAMLSLTAINRRESLTAAAATDDGGFASFDLDRIAFLLRAMSGDEHPVDPRLMGLVYRVQTHFDVGEIRVLSGYRVPGGRSRSNHGKGRALDLIVPGVPDEEVARFARQTGFVGVGVYPASQFVHIDVRPRSYFWVDSSGPRMKNKERGILGDLAAKSDAEAIARGQVPVESFAIATDVDAVLRARGPSLIDSPAADDDEDEEN